MRSKIIFTILLFSTAIASRAFAFADASQFFVNGTDAATLGASSEGIYFTGAPRFVSQTCGSCHVDAPNIVGLKLGVDDESLFTDGYKPGQVYEFEVSLQNETRGTEYNSPTCTEPPTKNDHYTYVQCNNNGFGLEVDAGGVPLAGPAVFCAAPLVAGVCPAPDPHNDEALVAPDGDAVFENRAHSADPASPKELTHNGMTSWHLWWTAPARETGPVTIYVAAVDGNGGDGTDVSDQDPYNDDVVQASFFVQESGGQIFSGATAGCSFAGRDSGSGALCSVLILLVALIFATRLARRVR